MRIRDTEGTLKNCPGFWGGLISQLRFQVPNRPRTEVVVHNSPCVIGIRWCNTKKISKGTTLYYIVLRYTVLRYIQRVVLVGSSHGYR